MPDIKSVLNTEIRRLAKKEVKAALMPFQTQITALKKTIAAQKAKLKTLEKRIPAESVKAPVIVPVLDKSVRLSPQWIIKLRQKLDLTQEQFAALLGTSNFSVSHWELGKTMPRDVFKRKIAALRGIGKRELNRLLAATGGVPAATVKEEKSSSPKKKATPAVKKATRGPGKKNGVKAAKIARPAKIKVTKGAPAPGTAAVPAKTAIATPAESSPAAGKK